MATRRRWARERRRYQRARRAWLLTCGQRWPSWTVYSDWILDIAYASDGVVGRMITPERARAELVQIWDLSVEVPASNGPLARRWAETHPAWSVR